MSDNINTSPFTLTIDHDAVRRNYQRDITIYGNAMIRSIKRGDSDNGVVIEADDFHGLIAALNICLGCVTSQEALDEFREVVSELTTKVANENQARRLRNDDIICPKCGSNNCVETYPGEFACEECDHEWESNDDE